MQVTEALPTATDYTLESPITSGSVDDAIHLVLAPSEHVRTFCFARRLTNTNVVHVTTIVLAEHHLLLIRPTTDGRYALDLAEHPADCFLVTSKRRADGSLLLAVSTPSGLLSLEIDSSWSTQADALEAALAPPQLQPTNGLIVMVDGEEHAPPDGVSFDGDGFDMVKQLTEINSEVRPERPERPDDIWLNERT